MSVMIEQTRPAPADLSREEPEPPPQPTPRPSAGAALEDQFPPWLKAPRSLAVFTAAIGLIYFGLSRLAIRSSDVWGHLAYGRWILAQGHLPETEPLLPLCRGVPWVDTAWLAKVAGVWVFGQFGVAGLQFIHAATLTAAFAVLAWDWQRRTRSTGWVLAGLAAFGLVTYEQLLIQRPQDVGVAAFACVLASGLGAGGGRLAWFGLPLLFALWANVHGSFVMGLAVLAACAVGGAIDVFRLTQRFKLAFRSRLFWRPFLLLELCAAAALLNPSGVRVYLDVLSIATHPNVPLLFDWSPLTIRTPQGQMFALTALGMGFVLRLSPRRVRAAECLLLIGFGAAALWSQRMIVWWGPMAGGVLAVHGWSAWRRRRGLPLVPAAAERRGLWTVTAVGLAWIYFAYSPFGLQRIHGRPTGEAAAADFRRNVVERTPLDAVQYLQEHAEELPGGQMYNSHEFGDYLLWAAPAKFGLFVHSHVHMIPEEVWNDFLAIHDGAGDWAEKLDRYSVNTVLVDTTNYMGLIRALRDHEEWREVFADPRGLAVLFVRKHPL